MGRKKKLPEIENIEIVDVGAEGKAIGKYNEKVVFVPFAITGDRVNIQLTKKRKNYYEGFVTQTLEYSPQRTEARCEHFGICGGCKWQHMDYRYQLYYKEKQVKDNLQRIAKVKLPPVQPILPSPAIYHYRNKLEFTFSNKRWITGYSKELDFSKLNMNGLGFHLPKKFDRILDIRHCYLQETLSDKIRLAVKDYAISNGLTFYDVRNWEGLLRNLIIRNTIDGEWMIILSFLYEDKAIYGLLEFLKEKFPEVTSLMYVINPKKNDTILDLEVKLYAGKAFISEKMEDITFKIGPKSFYQTNSEQALRMYRIVRDFAGLSGAETVYDLYTGTGTIALFVARKAKKVIGIEYVEAAIEDARENAILNDINNTTFFAGDMVNVLDGEFIRMHGKPDVIITDPPRAGMHPKVVEQIIKAAPEKIVYVSCNPATQARDLSLLDTFYEVKKVQPVDMFPHTHHVENVVLLKRREA